MRSFLLVLCLLFPLYPQEKTVGSALGALKSDAGRAPSVEELFMDLSTFLGSARPVLMEALRARLTWTDRRLHVLLNLQRMLRDGVSLELPVALLSPILEEADVAQKERLEREIKELEARQIAAREHGSLVSGAPRPRGGETAGRISVLGEALLALHPELPIPPRTEMGRVGMVAESADKEALGRSLQRLGDYSGALNAFQATDEKTRSLSAWYRMGQCAEKLGRFKASQGFYERVVKLAAGKIWGQMAQQRLVFGRKLLRLGKQGKGKP